MAHPFDIVGYTYKADSYCSGCIVEQLPTGEGGQFDGWALAQPMTMSTEADLNEIAFAFGINREDEETFDSDEFPKVLLRQMLEGDEHCGYCQCELEDE